jgi:hypothetical protein
MILVDFNKVHFFSRNTNCLYNVPYLAYRLLTKGILDEYKQNLNLLDHACVQPRVQYQI